MVPYIAAAILLGGILFVAYKLLVAPVEADVELARGDKIVAPVNPVPVLLFAEDEIQTFTNEQSKLVESKIAPGAVLCEQALELDLAFEQGGWVIVQATPRSADWSGAGKLHFLARGAGRPTAVRVVVKTEGAEHACWHDTALAANDWALVTMPLAKIEDANGRGLVAKGIQSINVEIHTDRKLTVKGEEPRTIVLGGLWTSSGK